MNVMKDHLGAHALITVPKHGLRSKKERKEEGKWGGLGVPQNFQNLLVHIIR